MKELKQEFNALYRAAVAAGLCRTQKEFAELVGVNNSTISLALKGDERYVSDKLLYKVKQILSEHSISNTGVMGTNNGSVSQKNFAPADTLTDANRHIDQLLAQQAEFLKLSTELARQNSILIERLTQ